MCKSLPNELVSNADLKIDESKRKKIVIIAAILPIYRGLFVCIACKRIACGRWRRRTVAMHFVDCRKCRAFISSTSTLSDKKIFLNFWNAIADNQNDSFEAAPKYVKHISKSASELTNNRDGTKATPQETPTASPQRARGAINPAVSGVLQRTHGFFSTLKVIVFDQWKLNFCKWNFLRRELVNSIDGREVGAKSDRSNNRFVMAIRKSLTVMQPIMGRTIAPIRPPNRHVIDRPSVDRRSLGPIWNCGTKAIRLRRNTHLRWTHRWTPRTRSPVDPKMLSPTMPFMWVRMSRYMNF